ncbi:hypothetical protein MANES_09G186150v8 [Manihot esculenta]|uniref:Uncharacterized protein n=1 Tax=Manihot esculenta TaxID=3983 RepID=A0ACB7H7A7_MANES|nr:hypothetical protein MANES_09G186150v8 [Manihot esculenta]
MDSANLFSAVPNFQGSKFGKSVQLCTSKPFCHCCRSNYTLNWLKNIESEALHRKEGFRGRTPKVNFFKSYCIIIRFLILSFRRIQFSLVNKSAKRVVDFLANNFLSGKLSPFRIPSATE